MAQPQLEICCSDILSVQAAINAGAHRIELCSSLATGGLTPSAGLIAQALALRDASQAATAIHILIRPREGDFLYSPIEIDAMVADIQTARRLGAQGVVIGALRPDGSIDTATCARLIQEAGPMSITFHRAFDLCADPIQALEQIIDLRCHRILTSGCAPTALQGAEMLARLRGLAHGRIIILAASGINPSNASRILSLTGLSELHASARSPLQSSMAFRHKGVAMGAPDSDEYTRMVTDPEIVAQLLNILKTAQ